MIAICPAFGVVADDMFTNDCPFFEIRRREDIVFFGPMLNFRAQTIENLCTACLDDTQIFICEHKIIRSGICRVLCEIREDHIDVNDVLTAVGGVERCIVRSCIGQTGSAIGIDVGNSLVRCEFVDRAIVYAVHRLDLAALFRKINCDFIHDENTS